MNTSKIMNQYNNNNYANILDIPIENRPREKLRLKGPAALTDQELIAVVLGKGSKQNNVLQISEFIIHVIQQYGIEDLSNRLNSIHGLGEAKIFSIVAAIEFTKRILKPGKNIIKKPEDVYHWIKDIAGKKQEHFIVLSLNGANEIISKRIITIGLLNSSQIHPREVFSDPISDRAASVIIAHNHPSGITDPSPEDIEITKKLRAAGEILGIPVLDHVVFCENGFSSLLELGYL